MSEAFSYSNLPSTFGIEVDFDLSRPLDPDQQEQFRQLFYKHHLLVFRGQKLEPEEHARIGAYLGPIIRNPAESMGYISNVRPDGGLGSVELAFHSDLAFSPSPFDAISLYAVDVIDNATSTRFANGVRVYPLLSEELRQRLESLKVLHVFGVDLRGRNRRNTVGTDLPHAIHPLIMRHPVSGAPIVYVHTNQTDSIVDMDPDESERIIQELFGHLYQPTNIYEHRWHMNDLVIWDNLALQHARGDVSNVGPRTLHRVVNAKKGFFDMYPQFNNVKFGS